jgi:hypothetical protein
MSQQMNQPKSVIKRVVRVGFCAGLSIASMGAIADQGWSAPAPMGPYGGHFDFGVPAAAEDQASAQQTPQVGYAVYQQQDELPVINASYAQPASPSLADFSQNELGMIDSGWSLETQSEADLVAPQAGSNQNDIWALGEIQAEKLPALGKQPVEVAAVAEHALQPCVVADESEKTRMNSTHTPFQEAVLDEFEHGSLDMDAVAREADQLSRVEERQSQRRSRAPAAPAYFSSYMPDYALGVRRANAMDPLALIPQMRNPVQYFGFEQQ